MKHFLLIPLVAVLLITGCKPDNPCLNNRCCEVCDSSQLAVNVQSDRTFHFNITCAAAPIVLCSVHEIQTVNRSTGELKNIDSISYQNMSSQPIDSFRVAFIAFSNIQRTAENISFINLADKMIDTLKVNEKRSYSVVYNDSTALSFQSGNIWSDFIYLSPSPITPSNFAGLYFGSYEVQIQNATDSILNRNSFTGYISIDGKVKFLLSAAGDYKSIVGYVDPQGNLGGNILKGDSSILSPIKLSGSSIKQVNDSIVKITAVSSSGGFSQITFTAKHHR